MAKVCGAAAKSTYLIYVPPFRVSRILCTFDRRLIPPTSVVSMDRMGMGLYDKLERVLYP